MQLATSGPRIRFILTLTTCLLLLPTVIAWPGDDPLNRATLKGIKAIEVVVEELDPDVERDGLTKDQLRTDAELRLRNAGIRVMPYSPNSVLPFLALGVTTVRNAEIMIYAYSINLQLEQSVALIFNPSVHTVAPTWSSGSVGLVGVARIRNLRNRVADHVDKFINAYLEQNPKQ